MVVYNASGAWVTSEPMVLKEATSILGGLGAMESDDFNEVCYRVNAGESIETHVLIVDLYISRANEIDVYFGPGKDRSISRRELSSRT